MSSTCLDDAADLVVGIGRVAGEHFGLPGEQLLLIGRQRVPLRQAIRPVGELVHSRGSRPSRFWLAKICSRMAFQPMSNLPLNLSIHSCFGWCGEWRAAGNVVEEERLVGRRRIRAASCSSIASSAMSVVRL